MEMTRFEAYTPLRIYLDQALPVVVLIGLGIYHSPYYAVPVALFLVLLYGVFIVGLRYYVTVVDDMLHVARGNYLWKKNHVIELATVVELGPATSNVLGPRYYGVKVRTQEGSRVIRFLMSKKKFDELVNLIGHERATDQVRIH